MMYETHEENRIVTTCVGPIKIQTMGKYSIRFVMSEAVC